MSLLGVDRSELRSVLAQPKRVALLAYLAAAPPRGFHRRDSLLALFWPELDQEHARAALRQALHGLRRSLGEGTIESRGDEEIGLSASSVWCDAMAFDEAVRAKRHDDAVELFRGDLLDGFFLSGAPEFERWLEEERARKRRQACDSAWILADSCHVAGDAALAVHWARRAAALARDDEGAVRRLIALLGALGDRAGAVQAYDTFARRLAQEYEVEPAAETRALIAAVRSRETEAHTIEAPLAEPDAPLSEAIVATTVPLAVAEEVASPRRPRGTLIAGLATGLAALTLGAVLVGGPLSASRQPSDPAALDPGRVVVTAFSNRTGDSTLDNVSRLAGEEITRGLELTDVVEIADPGGAPLTRAVPAGHEAAAARSSALATGSGLAVWGSVDRRADRIELAVQIVDERSGRILRALEPVRGDPLDPHPALTTLRDHVMAVVAEAVDPRLAASASVAGDPPAYDAYLEFSTGVGIWYDGRNGRDALPHFRRAAALDSTFALPLIWSAWVYQTLGGCDSTAAMAGRLARLHLSRLERIQIDRQIDRCNGDLPSAYRRAHLLVEARPGSEVWKEQLARDALNFDRPREAVAILAQLHPDRGALRKRVSYYNWLTNAYHLLGEHDRELEVARRARERFPANLAALRMELVALASLGEARRAEVNARLAEMDALPPDPIRKTPTVMREVALDLATHGDSIGARAALARALAWHASRSRNEQSTEYGRFERALTHYAAGHADSARAIAGPLARAHPESDDYAGLLGVLAARRGDRAEAARADSVLSGLSRPYARGRATYWRACIAATLGRREEAVDLLKRARAQGHVFNGLFFLNAHLEPSFATLRGYAPFRELLRPAG